MYDLVRTEILSRLASRLDSDNVREVMNVIDVVMLDYNITRKETALILRDSSLVDNIKTYVLCRKVEGIGEASLANIYYSLRNFASSVGKPVKEITSNDIRGYLLMYQVRNNVKSVTTEKIRQRINGFFRWCLDEGLIIGNPCSKISTIKFEPSARHAISEEQLEYCRNACLDKRDKALLEVFYSTGARISEIARLNQSDIDWYEGSVRVFGKNKSYYTVYINTKARVALKSYLSSRKDDEPALFVSARGGKRLRKETIRTLIKAIGRRANIEQVLTPHVLRHTMATTALRNGAPMEVVQHMLNHKSPATTQVYAEMCQTNVAAEHRRTVI